MGFDSLPPRDKLVALWNIPAERDRPSGEVVERKLR
jgi:hypothetical protein